MSLLQEGRDMETLLLLDKELGFQVGCCSYRNEKCNLTLEATNANDSWTLQ